MSNVKKTIRCKGAVCWGPGEPMSIEEIQVEPPRASEVRVKLLCASLCHSDVFLWLAPPPLGLFPRILGHEGVGVVESVGEGVKDLKEGDVVIPSFIGECGECPNCSSGKANLCFKYPVIQNGLMPDQTSRMSARGKDFYHLFTCSTFCEYTVVNVNYVVKVDPRLAPTHASILSCGFSTGFGAVWKEAQIEKGATVAVFGLGGVGIGAVAAAQHLGASRIIGVDLNEKKEPKAKAFGMTDFINMKEHAGKSPSEVIKEMTGGLGVGYSFECSGAAALLNESLLATIPGRGVTVVVGVQTETAVPINPLELLFGRTMKGSIFGGLKPPSDLPALVSKCINKEIHLDGILTHKVDLVNINRAFELMKEPDCLKVLIEIDGTCM